MPRHYKNWLQAYIDYTKASESPTAFHFWTGVSTLAGALRRQVWIPMGYFEWTPNFYIVLVGPPGIAAKSTSIRIGLQLLEKLKLPLGPQSGTWQALTMSLEKAIQTVRYFDRDGIEQQTVMSAITMSVPEFGTFFHMEDSALIDVMVAMWDGQQESWRHETKTAGSVEIRNPWINLIACTTPSWLQEHFPEHMIGGGFTSRVLFIFGDKKRQFVAYPTDHIIPAEHGEMQRKLFEDLCDVATLRGEILLTDDAKDWGRQWYRRIWEERPQHLASERFSGYISRKQGMVHKLAMIIAAAKRTGYYIELDDLTEAESLVTSLEVDMLKAFESIGTVDSARLTIEVVSFVRNYSFIPSQKLWRLCMSTMSYKEFQDSVRAAIEGGLVIPDKQNNEIGLRYVK